MSAHALSRRNFIQGAIAGTSFFGLPSLVGCAHSAGTGDEALGDIASAVTSPAFRRPSEGAFAPRLAFDGVLGDRLSANTNHWLLLAPSRNPDMTAMLDGRQAIQPLVVWAGEFSGKYLISAAQAYVMTPSDSLFRAGNAVVSEMARLQGSDGYIGVFGPSQRMNGNWDAWNQYHCILGLYLWSRATRGVSGAVDALGPCLRAADFLARYSPAQIAAVAAGDECKNMACSHAFAILAQSNAHPSNPAIDAAYGAKAKSLDALYESGPGQAPTPNGSHDFYAFNQPRWEALHDVQTAAELHLMGDAPSNEAWKSFILGVWESIARTDVHNTGGFSSGEGACGNPYGIDAVETCATVAWMALCIDVLRLTGDMRAADALELATWNAALGAQSTDGRMHTYDTPMGGIVAADGTVRAGTRTPADEELFWQGTPNGRALSCCAMNGPRALGCLSEWAVMLTSGGIVINHYGPSTFTVSSPLAQTVVLTQSTTYPVSGQIRIAVTPDSPESFVLKLRIPAWSGRTSVAVNGVAQSGVVAGQYLAIARNWQAGDVIDVMLDMTPRLVLGGPKPAGALRDGSANGRGSIYIGPILMAYDAAYGGYDITNLPRIDRARVAQATAPITLPSTPPSTQGPIVSRVFSTTTGSVALIDFASAGQPNRALVASALLTSRTWQLSRSDGTILSERVQLLEGGTISGYANANEASWSIDGGDLIFRATNGMISSRFTTASLLNGKTVLVGPSLFTPTITHLMSEQDPTIIGKSWQFQRADGSVIARRIQLAANGTIVGYSHPNEARWGLENGRVVFYDVNGNASTRFDSQRTRRARTTLQGLSIPSPSITHMLVEIDDDVTNRIWSFDRALGDGSVTVISRLRLMADHTIARFDRQAFAHEARWDWDRDPQGNVRLDADGNRVLVFASATGVVSTRFDAPRIATSEGMKLAGKFVYDTTITHQLNERLVPSEQTTWPEGSRRRAQTDWVPGALYASWLPVS